MRKEAAVADDLGGHYPFVTRRLQTKEGDALALIIDRASEIFLDLLSPITIGYTLTRVHGIDALTLRVVRSFLQMIRTRVVRTAV